MGSSQSQNTCCHLQCYRTVHFLQRPGKEEGRTAAAKGCGAQQFQMQRFQPPEGFPSFSESEIFISPVSHSEIPCLDLTATRVSSDHHLLRGIRADSKAEARNLPPVTHTPGTQPRAEHCTFKTTFNKPFSEVKSTHR